MLSTENSSYQSTDTGITSPQDGKSVPDTRGGLTLSSSTQGERRKIVAMLVAVCVFGLGLVSKRGVGGGGPSEQLAALTGSPDIPKHYGLLQYGIQDSSSDFPGCFALPRCTNWEHAKEDYVKCQYEWADDDILKIDYDHVDAFDPNDDLFYGDGGIGQFIFGPREDNRYYNYQYGSCSLVGEEPYPTKMHCSSSRFDSFTLECASYYDRFGESKSCYVCKD